MMDLSMQALPRGGEATKNPRGSRASTRATSSPAPTGTTPPRRWLETTSVASRWPRRRAFFHKHVPNTRRRCSQPNFPDC
eukprot:1964263-Lingulodinium_polyedra.AAC.1